MPRAKPTSIYQLKVTLQRIRPPIWRRLLVPGNLTLPRLHATLQLAMGWQDYHLHQFTIAGQDYGVPDPEFSDGMRSELRVRLDQVVPAAGMRFTYTYDFGDDWERLIVVEQIVAPVAGQQYPVCIKGKRACPPEDVGGPWSYPEFVEKIRDPRHPEHDELVEWAGDVFDPEAFDLASINQRLALLR